MAQGSVGRRRLRPAAVIAVAAVTLVVFSSGGRATSGTAPGSQAAPVRPAQPVTIRIGVTGANGSTRATRMELEDYIARVVAGEAEPKSAEAAQQALAIAARTFALANLQRHRREGYDLCDTTHCQVMRPETAASRRAALATTGRVLVHEGQPANVFFSASCGGHTELASEVWPGAVNYGAVPQRDEACDGEPPWTSDLSGADLERVLRFAGHRGSRLRDLRVVQRNASQRVARLRADGFTPPEISGHDFRMAVIRVLGSQRMRSTAFDVRWNGNAYRFTGRGHGHGVGLCVIGAGHRAAGGATAADILGFYFPGLRIDTYGKAAALTTSAGARGRTARPGPAPPPSARPAPPAAPAPSPATPAPTPAPADPVRDVVVSLPPEETAERAMMLDLVRAARDRIAARAGVKPPPTIDVIVHPSIDDFRRATGEPWWVSGAADGPAIALPPLAVLRQRGQLERAVAHEVAHVLLDAALATRPLWVREGAAQYFAEPEPADAVATGRLSCPADFEFLRPLSAGAHRTAYARAAACFRRAIASGQRWQDVR